jgi:hypothetical protein
MLFFGSFRLFWEERTRDFAFVSLCYGRSGEEICMGYAMAASGRMQYDYKQTNKARVLPPQCNPVNASWSRYVLPEAAPSTRGFRGMAVFSVKISRVRGQILSDYHT